MAKILIVDDEAVYRRQLEISLSADQHEVRTAAHGREAIDVGTRYRPDVLMTDWMLKNHIHGMHVVQALRAFVPNLQTILITGFPSDDLKAEAAKAGVVDFIEKPFGVDRMRSAVQKASTSETEASNRIFLPMLEVDSTGSILYANSAARELFSETHAGRDATSFTEFFSPEEMPNLDDAVDRWIAATPRSDESTYWHLRSQHSLNGGGSRLIVMRRQNDPLHMGHTFVEMLLGIEERKCVQWPFESRALLLDGEPLLRKTFVSMLESAGGGCYAVETPTEAIRLLENDEGLRFVILDYDVADGSIGEIIERIKVTRPDMVIVGTSGDYRRDDFVAIGVEYFLHKPWHVDDLINVLTGRLGKCAECGLPLPLRRPKPGEHAGSWMCAFCGSRYCAMLDENFPPDVLQNVRCADQD